jgi:hypothetical protein
MFPVFWFDMMSSSSLLSRERNALLIILLTLITLGCRVCHKSFLLSHNYVFCQTQGKKYIKAMEQPVVCQSWAVSAATAINRKIGAKLADVINEASEVRVFEPPFLQQLLASGASGSAEQQEEVSARMLDIVIDGTRKAVVGELRKLRDGPEHSESDNKLYVEVVVRVVASNALYRLSLRTPPPVSPTDDDALQTSAASPTASGAESFGQAALVQASNKLVRGLLHAFEALQQVHMQDRSHYRTAKLSKQQLPSSAETPGWDTVPLMTLVHMIQKASQTAGTAVNEESLTQIVRSWRKLLIYLQSSDPGVVQDFSRRRGALAVVNGLIIMLFQHNNTHQCRTLLQSVEHSEQVAETTGDVTKSVLRPAAHMIAEVIKFRYYQGRMNLYEKKFAEAASSFTTAYRLTPPLPLCSAPQRENKLRIHFYRIVTGIVCGHEPPAAFLDVDPVSKQLFRPIIEAIREGNPQSFCRALDRNASLFRKRGVYMLLQQARILCYLYLLQRVHSLIGSVPGADSTKIPVQLILDAARLVMDGKSVADDASFDASEHKDEAGGEADCSPPPIKKSRMEEIVAETSGQDMDAMCLWICRLVSRGFVRGYLSYEHKTLVVAKATPFPSIAPPAS